MDEPIPDGAASSGDAPGGSTTSLKIRAELPMLFGDIAVAEGFITQEQLDEAVSYQAGEGDPLSLGEILQKQGYLQPEQVRQILSIHSARVKEDPATAIIKIGQSLFGQAVTTLGLASEEQVNAALREQGRLRDAGEAVPIGQVMMSQGVLTPDQVSRVLAEQNKTTLCCPRCAVQYNIRGFQPGRTFQCRTCKGELQIPEGEDPQALDPDTLIYQDAPTRDVFTESHTATIRPSRTRTDFDSQVSTRHPTVELKGELFGDYVIVKKVAQGGMGIVYQAIQRKLDRLVALKVMRTGEGASETELERFKREAIAAANLEHPNIVKIYEVGEVDGKHYFTMDFIKGRTLSRIVRKGGLPIREGLFITMKVAEGLEYAHQQGMVHRDIKPANIMVDHSGNPRITDFGIVKDLQADSQVTRTGEVMGTPAYMSPEQVLGDQELDGRADVYSLGAVLYELITGRPPFQGDSAMDILLKTIKKEPVRPREQNRSIHKDVETICLKALEKDPEKRYPTAEAMRLDIQRYLNGEMIDARPIGFWERCGRKIIRHKAISATVAAALAVIIAITSVGVGLTLRERRAHLAKVSGHIDEARRLLGDRRPAEARLAFEKALALEPESPAARAGIEDAETAIDWKHTSLINEGEKLLLEEKHAEAEQRFLEAIAIRRDSPEARDGASRAKRMAVQAGKLEETRREAEKLLREGMAMAEDARQAPDDKAGGLFVDALIRTRQAQAKDPRSDETRRALFDLLMEFARRSTDRQSFEMASFLSSEADILDVDDEAVAEFEDALVDAQLIHGEYNQYLRLGRERLSDGDFEGALRSIRQALEIAATPEAEEALRQARFLKSQADGDAHVVAERWEEALQSFRTAIENADEEGRAQVLPKHDSARDRVTAARIAAANQARVSNDGARAQELLQEALDIDPGNRLARTMLADLLRTGAAPEGKIYVRGGEYTLASDPSAGKRLVPSFYIDRHEVTNRQYQEFVDAGGYESPDHWDPEGWARIGELVSRDGSRGPLGWAGGRYPEKQAQHPVTGISWYEARAYARWRGDRLPTDAEWETAASIEGGTVRRYPWGDEWKPEVFSGGRDRTRRVGELSIDAGPAGVRDMGANASEWTATANEVEPRPVLKGASYLFPIERYARCSFRSFPEATYRSAGVGFRCVRDIEAEDDS